MIGEKIAFDAQNQPFSVYVFLAQLQKKRKKKVKLINQQSSSETSSLK